MGQSFLTALVGHIIMIGLPIGWFVTRGVRIGRAASWRVLDEVLRRQPKWVVSRSLKSVGPNATLIANDLEAAIRGLKAQLTGEIEVAGPELARSLTDLGLIDEYRIYLHPVVLGHGKPYFAGLGHGSALSAAIGLTRMC